MWAFVAARAAVVVVYAKVDALVEACAPGESFIATIAAIADRFAFVSVFALAAAIAAIVLV